MRQDAIMESEDGSRFELFRVTDQRLRQRIQDKLNDGFAIRRSGDTFVTLSKVGEKDIVLRYTYESGF
jgi:hypothetical protein